MKWSGWIVATGVGMALALGGCRCGETTGAREAIDEAPARVLAIVPADGSPPSVVRGYEYLVVRTAESARAAPIVRGELDSWAADWPWEVGDRVALGGTCTRSLPRCAQGCTRIETAYRTKRQLKFLDCEPSKDPNDVCWTSYEPYCTVRLYSDSSCTTLIEDSESTTFVSACD